MRSYAIEDIFREFKNHLRKNSKHLRCFSKYQYQSEGWFKAECIFILDSLRIKRCIKNFDREVKSKGFKKIDLVVDLDDGRHYIELKHWFMGEQKGLIWKPINFIESLEDSVKSLLL